MIGLLVSVRSATEARAAVDGGASVIDVKEPDHGSLGRASTVIWSEVRQAVPPALPVSVALGELRDWDDRADQGGPSLEGIALRKLGLAGAGPDWRTTWASIRRTSPGGPRWVAVAYADWEAAGAPDPEAVLDAAIEADDCSGLLVDTWDKSKLSPLEVSDRWSNWIGRARDSGRFIALAGGLDRAAIRRLSPLRPDLFAVRGAACRGSDRRGTIDPDRVAELVRVVNLF